MTGRVLLITGGATGIGAATARLAAREGYAVAINYRTKGDSAARLLEELRATGARAITLQADVRDASDVERLFNAVGEQLGPVTALVNSAGIAPPPVRVADVEPEVLTRVLLTNVLGTMLCCREAARRMSTRLGRPGGVIVNVSSMAATIGGRPGNAPYAGSKAAVDAFSVGFAKEVAREGIRVLSVRPGYTLTDMTRQNLDRPEVQRTIAESIPLGRPAHAEEVAAPIVWLLSGAASFMTGACIDVSGGGFLVGGQPPQAKS